MKRRITNRPEQTQQIALMEWVRMMERVDPRMRLVIHPPNAAKRGKVDAAMMKRAGMRAGVPDILCLFPSPTRAGLAIEMKAPGRRSDTSDAQREMMAALDDAGWRVVVCDHWTHAAREIAEHAGLPARYWPEVPVVRLPVRAVRKKAATPVEKGAPA